MAGKVIVKGDRVEARYKGKGTRYYRGVLSSARVADDGAVLFGVLYDDGDKEDSARGENIRRIGESLTDAEPPSVSGSGAAPPTSSTSSTAPAASAADAAVIGGAAAFAEASAE